MDTTKLHLGEPTGFIGITYRNTGYLQEQKWLNTAASPKPSPAPMTAHQTKPGGAHGRF